MKKIIYGIVLQLALSLILPSANAQSGQNEFEKVRVEGTLDAANSAALNTALAGDDAGIMAHLSTALPILAPYKGGPIAGITAELTAAITSITARGTTGIGENAAVIVVYRKMTLDPTNLQPSSVDYSTLKTLIYHKNKGDATISSYLLETKTVYFVFIDMSDAYYNATGNTDGDKKLSNVAFKIVKKTSFFQQSFKDLSSVWSGLMGGSSTNMNTLKLTIVKINPSQIKAPCDIVGSSKTITTDQMTYTVHELNVASFQVGIENAKYAVNDFSISGGNLSVTPDSAQKSNWKSSAYAILEIHIPRDIDTFQPLWKDIFSKGRHRSVGQYLYDATLSRIGIYGGVKISKDPLSNLYAGFNYALTKELAINFGWTWTNQITPQVSQIGNITSLSDALQYARRKYSASSFSIGLSFAPSAIITMLGLKSKS